MDITELVRLNNLQLAARVVSDRLLLGVHQSRRTGTGTEFEQYRPYFPGDDLRRVDWKLYARSGRYLVKESATESHLHIRLVLDLSGSMNYSEGGISRLDYSKVLLASLAYMAYRQNDPISFYTVKEGKPGLLVKEGKNAFYRILYHLENAVAEGKQGDGPFPEFHHNQKELLILVSDLLQAGNEWADLVAKTASPYRQILIIQVLGRQELDFNLKGFYRFKDLETGKELEMEAESVRKEYRAAFSGYLAALEEELKLPHVHLVRASLDMPLAGVISEALKTISTWNS